MTVGNPPAFPRDERYLGHNGMDLRDWFAGQALALCWQQATVMANIGQAREEQVPALAAGLSYMAADAMLVARAGTGLETEQAAPGTGEKLLTIARDFIDKHHVSCAEATGNDGVYAEAPLLVEQLAEVVGYYSYPEDEA